MSSKKYLKMNKKELLKVIQGFEKLEKKNEILQKQLNEAGYDHTNYVLQLKDKIKRAENQSDTNRESYWDHVRETGKKNQSIIGILEYIIDDVFRPTLSVSAPFPVENTINKLCLAISILLDEVAIKYVERSKKAITKIDPIKHEMYLVNAGSRIRDVISTIRRYTNKSFEEVKELVESCEDDNNVLIWSGESVEEATEVSERLKADGAITIYRPPWRDYLGMRKEPIKNVDENVDENKEVPYETCRL